jgi:hypothetical protein
MGCSGNAPASSDDSGESETDAALREAEASNAAPVGREAHRALRELAPKVSLGFIGEDSGSFSTALFRTGPAKDLSKEEVLRLFGFDVAAQLAGGEFSFRAQDKNDKDFWDTFVLTQFDAEGTAAAKKVVPIFTSKDVTGLAIMIVNDRVAFNSPVYLVARMKDGSLLALRGTIGGMAL